MRSASLLLALSLSAVTLARPTASPTEVPAEESSRRTIINNIVLFDAPAYPDPRNPRNFLANFQTYVALRRPQTEIESTIGTIATILKTLGVAIGNNIANLQERAELLVSIPFPGKSIEVTIPGCSQGGELPGTSWSDLGVANGVVSLGSCTPNAKDLEASVVNGFLDWRKVSASVFPSPNSGFGVISDIDDTVKVSNVLNTAALLQSTFIDEPKAVAGMPALYKSLSTSLRSPQFAYITSTPYQLYPFLNKFIDTSFPDAKGPIFTKNLTIINIPEAIKVFTDDQNTLEYKMAMVDRLRSMYPAKKWLAIGDSTQQDPEAYAASFKKAPGSFSCIWIRSVEGADNSAARFAAAFAGVPADRVRVFTDAEIPSLARIDVAGGKCS